MPLPKPSIEQASAEFKAQASGFFTSQVPKAYSDKEDLTTVSNDQIVIITISSAEISMPQDTGLTHFLCLTINFFSIEFLISSLKFESQALKVALLVKQYIDFLNILLILLACFLKPNSFINGVKSHIIKNTIKAAIQTIVS